MPRVPVTRNLAAEQDALRTALESPTKGGAFAGTPGMNIPEASQATRKLLQEQINMRVYGTGRPTFQTSGWTPEQDPATQYVLNGGSTVYGIKPGTSGSYRTEMPQIIQDGAITTAKPAMTYLDKAMSALDGYADDVQSGYQAPTLNDQGLTAAQQEYFDALNQQSVQRESDLVRSIREQTGQELAAAEQNYRATTGASMSTLAKIGALGTTSAGVQYMGDLDDRYQAKLNEINASAQNLIAQAQTARDERDIQNLGKRLEEIRANREELANVEGERLNNILKYQQILKYDRDNAQDTIDAMIDAAVPLEDLPDGFLDSIDKQLDLSTGTTKLRYEATLRATARDAEEKKKEDALKRLKEFQNLGVLDTLTDEELKPLSIASGISIDSLKEIRGGEWKIGKDADGNDIKYKFDEKTGEYESEIIRRKTVKAKVKLEEPDVLSLDDFRQQYIQTYGEELAMTPDISNPVISSQIDSLYQEYLDSIPAGQQKSGEVTPLEELQKDLTITDRQKMRSLGLNPDDISDIDDYIAGKFEKKEKTAHPWE